MENFSSPFQIKHSEAEDKISKLKEMLGRNEMKLMQTEELQGRLLETENHLKESEKYTQQLIVSSNVNFMQNLSIKWQSE